MLPIMRAALSRGDIGKISEVLAELLDRFHLNLDPNSAAYRKLGLAVLRAYVRALEALERRSKGEPVDTPAMAHLEPSDEQVRSKKGARCTRRLQGGGKSGSAVLVRCRNTNAQSTC